MLLNTWKLTKWQIRIEYIIYGQFLDAEREAIVSSSGIGTFSEMIVFEGLW